MKITAKRTAIAIVAVVVIIPAVLAAVIFVPPGLRMYSLQKVAAEKEKTLTNLQLLSDQGTVANGLVDGNMLSANPDSSKSTLARAQFTTDTTFGTAETDINANLASAGFVRDGTATGPYFKTYRNSGSYLGQAEDYTGISLRYTRGDEVVLIRYAFDKLYACPEGKTCERTAASKPTDDIYDILAYASLPIKDISIIYASQNYYQTQL